jgi:hypothetical protein
MNKFLKENFILFVIFIISFYCTIYNKDLRITYFNSLIILTLCFNFYENLIFIFKKLDSMKSKLLFCIRWIAYVLFINYFFKHHNPFNNLLFFWAPFPDFFRSIAIIILISFLTKREYDDNNKYENKNISCQSNSKYVLKIISIAILIKVILFFIDDKFSYLNYTHKNKHSKYFIASNLFNNELILNDWKREMKKLINYLGPENCYVSIVENGDSTDNTPKMLEEFEKELNEMKVVNKIITTKVIDKDALNLERIVFLTMLRNRALQFIFEIENLDFSNTKILFFNDIIYTFQDIVKLLNTNEGDYDLVCGMDFYESFYDTWVSRGVDGHPLAHYYPYFLNNVPMNRVIDGEPIRVYSCWNGLAVIKAEPFGANNLLFRHPVKYRQSECILLITDLWLMNRNKIFINPNVKFAYDYYYYYMNKYVYPWTKNIFTYFYYYFVNFNIESNYNFANTKDNNVILAEEWIYLMNTYLT